MGAAVELELQDSEEQEEDAVVAASLAFWEQREIGELQPHSDYQHRPVEWCRDKLGIPENTLRWSLNPGYCNDAACSDPKRCGLHHWDGTPDPLAAALEALAAGKCVVMESGTGTGKTFTLAVGQFWFQACWKNSLVRSHAPAQHQLEDHMWKEIADLWPRFKRHFPLAERSFLRVRMQADSDKWGAKGVVAGVKAAENETGSATKAQGAHAEHMLSIVEETPGMPPPIMTAIRQTSVSSHNLIWAVGNPDHQFDELHKLVKLPRFVHIRVSALDHPNVVCDDENIIPGAVTRMRVEEAKLTDGEGSPMYDSRVRGISPKQSAESLIQYDWLEEAAKRWEARDKTEVEKMRGAKGVDVAQSKNGDKASIATMRGEYLVDLWADRCRNATQLGRDVIAQCRASAIPFSSVGVDGVGIGAATVNAIAEIDPTVNNLVGGPVKSAQRGDEANEWCPDGNLFVSLRDQMWWTLREDIRLGRWHGPRHEALWKQLVLVKFKRDSGKVRVESKEDIKKRTGGHSPDEADAVVYANWVRPREVRVETPVVPIDPNRDEGAQESEWHQKQRILMGNKAIKDEGYEVNEMQYGAPDETGAFSQFPM